MFFSFFFYSKQKWAFNHCSVWHPHCKALEIFAWHCALKMLVGSPLCSRFHFFYYYILCTVSQVDSHYLVEKAFPPNILPENWLSNYCRSNNQEVVEMEKKAQMQSTKLSEQEGFLHCSSSIPPSSPARRTTRTTGGTKRNPTLKLGNIRSQIQNCLRPHTANIL